MDTNKFPPARPADPVRIASATVHVGTSGWHYKPWIGDFYPPRFAPAKMLGWYAREFNTVEINNSFYRLPEEKTFREWASIVPRGFLFSVKASRFLTHIKRLKDAEDPIRLFFSRARFLGRKLGPVLFQLPPKWKADHGRLREFLELLPPNHTYAIEFRDPTWYNEPIYELLRSHDVALCMHDWHSELWPQELTAKLAYLRFHGTTGRYAGNYPDQLLEEWAKKIATWSMQLDQFFVYFNNDVAGHAVRNAITLRAALHRIAAGSDSASFQRVA
jgi:uncharacterized protein YecE (DUF72 family)